MQRSRQQLETMSHDELIDRVLEMQDMLKEGLAVRDSLHKVLNQVLKAKAEEVTQYASLPESQLDEEEIQIKQAWAAARHAVSNPHGLMMKQKEHSS